MSAIEQAITGSSDVVGHLINGKPVTDGGRTAPVYNPATGQVARHVSLANKATVEAAIDAAAAAFPAWRDMPPLKRARIMFRFKDLLEKNEDRIVAAITAEHGKVIEDARGEFQRGVENVEYACSAPELLKGEHSKNVGPAIDSWSEMQPLGVVAGITPFNFPAMVPLWMYPMALVCGNTFILKPSERDPTSALLIGELLSTAGLPDGVFNIVNGDKEAVDAIIAHPTIQSIGFVGSTPIAEYIYAGGCAAGKRVQCFGGAKNHAIIMPDADMDNVVDALIGAGYGAAGERCMAISVAVPVGEDTADRLIAALSPRVESLKIGPYTSGGDVDFGPVITGAAKQKINDLVESGIAQGATLAVDGRGFSLQGYEDGFFVGASLFDNVTTDMDIYKQEIFGPVLSVVRAKTYEEAIGHAMDHEYGNGTAIFTRDGDTARDFASRINVGMVGVNVPIPVPLAYHTFGGWKKSAFGDLNQHGPDAFKFYTRTKTVTSRWPSGTKEGAEFSIPTM